MENGISGLPASPDFRALIDWRAPWLAPLRGIGEPLCNIEIDWHDSINLLAQQQSITNHRGKPIVFVPQAALPAKQNYESFISETGCVPSRQNLHDFFNALIWLHFPQIKARLNALQSNDIGGAQGNVQLRSRLRDGLTLFDENAALVISSDLDLLASLRARDWPSLFITRRSDFQRDCTIQLFGHALCEKLVSPYKAITAHAWLIAVEADFFRLSAFGKLRYLDARVAAELDTGLRPQAFSPLPVSGVPGWWDAQTAAFYGDTAVFRRASMPLDRTG
jgi:hypothetical protein